MIRSRILPFMLSAHTALPATAQNLVPNGGFEEVIDCPDWQSQLDRTAFWFDPSEGGTPDYYHACATNAWYATPGSTVGFQETVDGQAYAGIFLWIEDVLTNWREYLEVGLASPLVQGQCYRLSLRANLADFSGFTTDALGVCLAQDSILAGDPYPPGIVPQVLLSPGTFLDRDAWTLLQGDFIAQGGERFLMIGNFSWDAQTTTPALPDGPPNTGDFAYALVDAVSLTPCSAITIGLEEQEAGLVQGTVLFTDRLEVNMGVAPDGHYSVLDAQGRLMCVGSITDSSVDTANWSQGPYVVEIRSIRGRVWRRAVIKG
jgi:hypothetical protein